MPDNNKLVIIVFLFLLVITFATLFGVYYQKYIDKKESEDVAASMEQALLSCTSNLEAAYSQIDGETQPATNDLEPASQEPETVPESYANIMTGFDGEIVHGEPKEQEEAVDYNQYANFVRT